MSSLSSGHTTPIAGARFILYPPVTAEQTQSLYPIGSQCLVLKSGKVFARGTVETFVQKVESKYAGRMLMRFSDNSSAHIRPRMLIPCLNCTTARVTVRVVTETTDFYRRMAKSCISASDFCIEIGSDFGVTTEVIAQSCRKVVGVDKSKSSVIKAREQYPLIPFLCCDVFREPDRLKMLHAEDKVDGGEGINVAFIDINGNRPLPAVLECVDLVERLLAPRIIVIKSKELFQVEKIACTRPRSDD